VESVKLDFVVCVTMAVSSEIQMVGLFTHTHFRIFESVMLLLVSTE